MPKRTDELRKYFTVHNVGKIGLFLRQNDGLVDLIRSAAELLAVRFPDAHFYISAGTDKDGRLPTGLVIEIETGFSAQQYSQARDLFEQQYWGERFSPLHPKLKIKLGSCRLFEIERGVGDGQFSEDCYEGARAACGDGYCRDRCVPSGEGG